MPATLEKPVTAPPETKPRDAGVDRRWLILAVVVLAQLMVVLDASIVNIALPDLQGALDISDGNRQWVVTAYALGFGGLLLLGGRIADYTGRRRIFVVGAAGFAIASAIGGLATTELMLYAARALQGAFAALLAPAALSILTTSFPGGPDRSKAFALYGAVSAGGAAVGLLLGGVLVEYLNWRWTLFINIPIAVVAGLAALRFVPESKTSGTTRYDLPGAATVTTGLVALVYGFTKAESDGWGAPITLALLAVGVVLLAAFVLIERRSSQPLLPLRIPLDRSRGGAYLVAALVGGAMIGTFLFLVYYFQVVEGYSAIKSGLAALPFAGATLVASAVANRPVARFGPRVVMGVGSLIGAGGLFWLAQLTVDSSYIAHVGPAVLLLGFGLGLTFVPMGNIATLGVDPDDAGAASAMNNASMQIGSSLGTALLNTFAATAVANYLVDHPGEAGLQHNALVDGYAVAFSWGAVLLVIASAVSFLVIRARKADVPASSEAVPAMA